MTKSKSNALDALRALIAERQQYDQWISTLESKRDGTAEHVFNRVYSDYQSRLDRVLDEIRSHAEELQLSITALSARLGEVAKDEEAKRDSLTEAELRAAVGEYDVAQWESMRAEANRQLEKIAADRVSLEAQLAELESIRKLSEVTASSGEGGTHQGTAASQPPPLAVATGPDLTPAAPSYQPERDEFGIPRRPPSSAGWPTRDVPEEKTDVPPVRTASAPFAALPAQSPAQSAPPTLPQTPSGSMDATVAAPRPSASPVAPPPAPAPPARKKRDTPSGKDAQISSGFSKPVPTPSEARPEVNKTLKCPECGTANYPTEWYCERCGGELATM
jgi:hypothetical protein